MNAPTITDATRLAVERTRLAYERTLMAWVRTATSLISFGFTLFKFFQYLHQAGTAAERPPELLGARQFAMLMIATGLLALVIATVQHVRSTRALRAEYGPSQAGADRYEYVITHRGRSVRCQDGAVPADLQPLITALNGLVRR